ncbi:hypothetical protein HMI55_003583 [Coelomomyces lativittatus]|nr:hypothetical protein HMI55_003583 [Coelomomyces lativittatus]
MWKKMYGHTSTTTTATATATTTTTTTTATTPPSHGMMSSTSWMHEKSPLAQWPSEYLYFLCRKKESPSSVWGLVQGLVQEKEMLHEAVHRTLIEQGGTQMTYWLVGKAPIALSHVYPNVTLNRWERCTDRRVLKSSVSFTFHFSFFFIYNLLRFH